MAARGLVHIGSGDHNAYALAVLRLRDQADDQLPEILAGQRVDAGGGFIQQQDARASDQGRGQPQFLLHAARKLPGEAIFEGRQPDKLEDFHAAWIPLAGGQAAHLGEEADILQHGQVFIQRKTLRKIANLCPGFFGRAQHVTAVDADQRRMLAVRRGAVSAAQHAQGGGFSSAIRPDQAVDLAGCHLEADILNSLLEAKMAREMGGFDQILHKDTLF